jgi:DNA-binding MarR family transcriptional regulator
MKTRNSLTPAEIQILVAEWKLPKKERQTQQELALRFNVAEVTIRRALADAGLIELKHHKTPSERAILNFLQSQGLNELKKLQNFVVKARQGNRVP